MKSLRILVNGIELPHVREDAKIHDENSSFFDEIRVQHNTRPIRVVENEDTLKALGEFSITQAKKRKRFPCKVVIGAIRYNGVLTQNEKIAGFRKCDLKFGSEVNEIMDKKIASFFPKFSVTGAAFPEAFKDESKELYECQEEWNTHAESLRGKIYPQVKWQMPEIAYRDRFGTDLAEDDAHALYFGYINGRSISGLLKNEIISNATYFKVHNKNVIAPQIFWLSPIFYSFQSIGYSLMGNVVNHPFFKRLLLLSENDNMVKVPVQPTGEPLRIDLVPWTQRDVYGVIDALPYRTYVKEIDFTPENAGEYIVAYDFSLPLSSTFYGVQIYKGNALIARAGGLYGGTLDGKLRFTVEEGEENTTYTFIYHHTQRVMPTNFKFGWYQNLNELDFYEPHPTIDFSRYIPEWTTADYLNNFQKLFNLKIDIDDVEKTIFINFNEEDYLVNGKIVPIFKSLQIAEAKSIAAESYYLKYANDIDQGKFAAQHDDVKNDENTEPIETEFKYIPFAQLRHQLSQEVEDKDGVGLMLYDSASHPGTVESYNGINLRIPGEGGIFETFYKRWILFRLNASPCVLKGPFSKTELYQISKHKKLLIDNQVWMVKSIDYKENSIALFETEIDVESVTF